MARFKTLPLGVDIGTARLRVALAERGSERDARLLGVASREIPDDVRQTPALVAALLDEAIAELGTKERRCVTCLGGAEAALRVVRLPKMSWSERLSAARYEARRFAGADKIDEETIVRVHRALTNDGAFAIGAAPKLRVDERTAIVKLARLRQTAMEHDAVALRRALPFPDAILDIGCERSTLHAYAQGVPYSYHCGIGGGEVTRGIARELCIDGVSAERRKRILGAAGGGGTARNSLVAECAELVSRAQARCNLTRIALVGNGARLPGLAADLEARTGAIVELPVSPMLESSEYPEDVLRVAAPDWTLAVALTTWCLA